MCFFRAGFLIPQKYDWWCSCMFTYSGIPPHTPLFIASKWQCRQKCLLWLPFSTMILFCYLCFLLYFFNNMFNIKHLVRTHYLTTRKYRKHKCNKKFEALLPGMHELNLGLIKQTKTRTSKEQKRPGYEKSMHSVRDTGWHLSTALQTPPSTHCHLLNENKTIHLQSSDFWYLFFFTTSSS